MKSVNKVILIGNLGKDPEVTQTTGGKSVAKFSLATNEYMKKDGEKQERTEWHNIVLWEKLAEICGQYLKKGSKVYLEGRIQTHSWEDKDSGQKKYMTEVIAHDMVMLDRKETDSAAASPTQVTTMSPITDEDIPF